MTLTPPPLAIAVCCREWPVSLLSRVGHCGFCGERPIIDWAIDVPAAELLAPWPEYDMGWTR
jgi:hypothetical protein